MRGVLLLKAAFVSNQSHFNVVVVFVETKHKQQNNTSNRINILTVDGLLCGQEQLKVQF